MDIILLRWQRRFADVSWRNVTPQLTNQRFYMVHLVQVNDFALIDDNSEQRRGIFILNG